MRTKISTKLLGTCCRDYRIIDRKETDVAAFTLKGETLGRQTVKTKQNHHLSQTYFYEENYKLY